jgi:hypothetical protein
MNAPETTTIADQSTTPLLKDFMEFGDEQSPPRPRTHAEFPGQYRPLQSTSPESPSLRRIDIYGTPFDWLTAKPTRWRILALPVLLLSSRFLAPIRNHCFATALSAKTALGCAATVGCSRA